MYYFENLRLCPFCTLILQTREYAALVSRRGVHYCASMDNHDDVPALLISRVDSM